MSITLQSSPCHGGYLNTIAGQRANTMSMKRLFSRKGKTSASARTNSFLDEQGTGDSSSASSSSSRMNSVAEKTAANAPMSSRRPHTDAPPPYTASPTTTSPLNRPSRSTTLTADDPYTFLSTFDTLLLIDDSGSMTLGTRWHQTLLALQTITPIITAHDHDGLDLHFLNKPPHPSHKNLTTPSSIASIFSTVRPSGGTPTGQRLNAILKPYLATYTAHPETTKPINLICITDGCPSDDVESVLISCAKRLDALDAPAWQVGIQFFQVGDDADARAHLEVLDDELAALAGERGCRDIVDTVPFLGNGGEGGGLTGEGILKVVLGAVNRRLDRKRV